MTDVATDAEKTFQFMKMPTQVLKLTDLGPVAKLALVYLLDRHSSISSWPGVRKISDAIGVTRYSAAKAVTELTKTRLLVFESGEARSKKRKQAFQVSHEPIPETDPICSPQMSINRTTLADYVGHNSDQTQTTTTSTDVVVRERQKFITKMLAEECYEDMVIPRSEWGRIGKAAQSLARDGVTADEVAILIDTYKREWPKCTLTPTAIANNVANLRRLKKEAESDYDRRIDEELRRKVEV